MFSMYKVIVQTYMCSCLTGLEALGLTWACICVPCVCVCVCVRARARVRACVCVCVAKYLTRLCTWSTLANNQIFCVGCIFKEPLIISRRIVEYILLPFKCFIFQVNSKWIASKWPTWLSWQALFSAMAVFLYITTVPYPPHRQR